MTEVQVILHDVHDGCHLEEDKHSVSSLEQLGEHAVQELKLSSDAPESVVVSLGRVDDTLNLLKDIRMVANLSELHDSVIQSPDTGASICYNINRHSISTRAKIKQESDKSS
jgi:hypothetical protein